MAFAQENAQPKPREPKSGTRTAIELVVIVGIALGLVVLLNFLVVKPYRIPSESMEPTLKVGQRVLANRVSYDFGGSPARNDIVVFHPPVGADQDICGVPHPDTQPCPRSKPDEDHSVTYIKRVVGLPGDMIAIRDSRAVVNGRVQKERFIEPCAPGTCTYPEPIKVPAGHFFMMGDNRGRSDDSRYWGPIPESWIIGRAVATYWPPDRVGFF